jgi:hypothetical protein
MIAAASYDLYPSRSRRVAVRRSVNLGHVVLSFRLDI